MRRHASALVETVLGTAAITIVGVLVPGQWGLLGWHPHPLWIVVLAIAIRYGAPMAYVAGALAAASYLSLAVVGPGGMALPDSRNLVEPFLFLVVGGAVGEVVRGTIRQLDAAMASLQRDEAERAELDQRLQTALAVKGELEKRVVNQPTSVATLYGVAKRLDVRESAALYAASLELITEYLEADSSALYMVGTEGLRLREGRPSSVAERPRDLSRTEGLAARALKDGRVVTAWEPGAPTDAAAQWGILAGPLRGAEGAIVGIVVVESLPFLRLSPTTIRLFEILLEWSSTALKNALRLEDADAGNIRDPRTGLYLAAHTQQVLAEEIQRARRYELPLSIVALRIEGGDGGRVSAPDSDWAALGQIAAAQLRAADTLGRLGDAATALAILPMTEAHGAAIIGQRLIDRWGAADPLPATLTIGVATLSAEFAEPATLVARALSERKPVVVGTPVGSGSGIDENAAD